MSNTTTAVVEAGEIVLLGIYCDKCGAAAHGDFKVRSSDSRETRLGYVRAWAEQERGWEIRPGLDLCGDCSRAESRLLEGLDRIGRHMRAGEWLEAAAALADVRALVKADRS